MERIAKETYDGKLKKGGLDPAHIQKTYNELHNAAQSGNKAWLKVNKATGTPSLEALKMQQNLYWFSGAKDYTMLVDLNSRLVKEGKIQNWNAFKKEALKLNKTYNKNYLEAEWINAKQSAKQAQNWQEYQRNKDKYKNLKYKTQGDDRVREEHAKLNGIIKPINDPFWDSYYPQNGWRCRCYVVQTNEAAWEDAAMPDITEKDVAPEFRNNVGKTGQTFKESTTHKGKAHPFIQFAKKNAKKNEVERLFFKLQQQKASKKLLNLKIKHPDIKTPITFTNTGIKEAFNQPHKKYGVKNMVIQYMDTLLPKATYLGFIKIPKNNPMIVGSHIFKTVIDSVDSFIIIREVKNGELVFYSISDSAKVVKGIKK